MHEIGLEKTDDTANMKTCKKYVLPAPSSQYPSPNPPNEHNKISLVQWPEKKIFVDSDLASLGFDLAP